MKDGTDTKLKFKQLQRALNLTLWQARGLLDTLWTFARNNCPRGDIGRFTDEEIAIGIDWQGNAQELLKTLTDARWVDACEECRLVVHDWPEHCEDSVHKSLIKTTEIFADGTFPSLARIEKKQRPQIVAAYQHKYGKEAWKHGKAFKNACGRQETPENAPTIPSLTLPNPTIPSPTTTACGQSAAAAVEFLISQKAESGAAKSAVDAAIKSNVTAEQIFKIIEFWKGNRGWGIGALVRRIQNATPRSDPTMGWPESLPESSNGGPPQPSPHKLAEDRFYAAQRVIDRCRRQKKSQEETDSELVSAGFDLKEAYAAAPGNPNHAKPR